MDEVAAREWLEQSLDVSRETLERISFFLHLLRQENETQNLVSRASLEEVWSRHVVDSAQLIRLARPASTWIDLGTGAGFPGLIIACLHAGPVTLVEERRLRADFLCRAVELLGIGEHTNVVTSKAERVERQEFGTISARAFAPLPKLFSIGLTFCSPETRWILPKGRNAKSELAAAESSWQGAFRVEPSVTDPEAGIIVAEGVRRRAKGRMG